MILDLSMPSAAAATLQITHEMDVDLPVPNSILSQDPTGDADNDKDWPATPSMLDTAIVREHAGKVCPTVVQTPVTPMVSAVPQAQVTGDSYLDNELQLMPSMLKTLNQHVTIDTPMRTISQDEGVNPSLLFSTGQECPPEMQEHDVHSDIEITPQSAANLMVGIDLPMQLSMSSEEDEDEDDDEDDEDDQDNDQDEDEHEDNDNDHNQDHNNDHNQDHNNDHNNDKNEDENEDVQSPGVQMRHNSGKCQHDRQQLPVRTNVSLYRRGATAGVKEAHSK